MALVGLGPSLRQRGCGHRPCHWLKVQGPSRLGDPYVVHDQYSVVQLNQATPFVIDVRWISGSYLKRHRLILFLNRWRLTYKTEKSKNTYCRVCILGRSAQWLASLFILFIETCHGLVNNDLQSEMKVV